MTSLIKSEILPPDPPPHYGSTCYSVGQSAYSVQSLLGAICTLPDKIKMFFLRHVRD